MNPLTNIRNIAKLNEQELKLGVFDEKLSWHNEYKDSAYIFIGGLPYDLSEGDLICVFSQYGEIVNINLVRDKQTGKTKGYGFLAYEDQRSTILAVDNLNSAKLGGRTLRVDHVSEYRRPKGDEKDESGKFKEIIEEGCAPKTPPTSESEDDEIIVKKEKKMKHKKEKKKKKKKDNREKIKTDIKKEIVDKDQYRYDNTRSRSGSNKYGDSKDRSKSPENRASYHKTKRDDKLNQNDYEQKSKHSYRDSYTKDPRVRIKRERSYTPERSSRKHRRRSNSPHQRDRSRDYYSNRRH